MPGRVKLFIDYQNVYRGARESFHQPRERSIHGQIWPEKVGALIVGRDQSPGNRTLKEVRVYTGRPSPSVDSKTYGAWRAQTSAWEKSGATVISRALSYPPSYPKERPREKGIDVSLAVDFVAGAVDGAFDVGVIFSTDRDLLPALEFVAEHPDLNVVAEVAAWWAPGANAPLTIKGLKLWCHLLERQDYQLLRDDTSYARRR